MMICWLAMAHLSQILFSMSLWAVMSAESNFKSQEKHCSQQRVACPLMCRLQTGHSLCICSHCAMHVRWQRCLQGSYRFTSESRQNGHVSVFLYEKYSSSFQFSSKRISICEIASAGSPMGCGCLTGRACEGALLKLVIEIVSLHRLTQQQQQPRKTSATRLMEAMRYAILNALLADTKESSMVRSQLGLHVMHMLLGQDTQLEVEQGRQLVFALKQVVAQMVQERLLVQEQQEEGQLVHWLEVALQYCDPLQLFPARMGRQRRITVRVNRYSLTVIFIMIRKTIARYHNPPTPSSNLPSTLFLLFFTPIGNDQALQYQYSLLQSNNIPNILNELSDIPQQRKAGLGLPLLSASAKLPMFCVFVPVPSAIRQV